jgi:hypothetical protein
MNTELIEHQKLSAIVENYEQTQAEIRQGFDLLATAKERLEALLGEYHDDIFPERISDRHLRETAVECANFVRRNAWKYLLDHMQVWSIMSDSAKNHLMSQLRDNKMPEITHENVLGTFRQFLRNADTFFEDAVKEVFNFLRPGPWRERYKTNLRYKIGPRVILTWAVDSWSIKSGMTQSLRALDNVFHRLDGKGTPKYPDDLVTVLTEAIRKKAPVLDTPYFSCKWYKNGNLHVEFRRLDLLKQLNQLGGNSEHVPGPEEPSAG